MDGQWVDALFEQAPIALAVVSADHHFGRCNSAFCDLVGYSKYELTTRTWQSITHPDDVPGDQSGADAARVSKSTHAYTIQKRYLTKSGSVVWVNLYVRSIWKGDVFDCYFVTAIRLPQLSDHSDIKPASPHSISKWVTENPKDAAIVALAMGAFLGRDAFMDLLKVIFQK